MATTNNTPEEHLLEYLHDSNPTDYNSAYDYQLIIENLKSKNKKVPEDALQKILEYWNENPDEYIMYEKENKSKKIPSLSSVTSLNPSSVTSSASRSVTSLNPPVIYYKCQGNTTGGKKTRRKRNIKNKKANKKNKRQSKKIR